MARTKELDFFRANKNWQRGMDWYRAQFDPKAEMVGETSPNYTAHPRHPGIAERMADVLRPDVKFIYVVRDPIERIRSQYVHYCAIGLLNHTLDEALLGNYHDGDMLHRSRYYYQLSQFTSFFPREQIHLITLDNLRRRRQETLSAAFKFIGVDPSFRSRRFNRLFHLGRHRRRLTKLGRRLSDSPAARASLCLPPRIRPRFK
jgi:hypothetical protein